MAIVNYKNKNLCNEKMHESDMKWAKVLYRTDWEFKLIWYIMGSDAVILNFPGRIVIGLFGKTVPKTAGKVFKFSVILSVLTLHH